MQTTLLGLYLTVFIIACLLVYGGYESTIRLFYYLDLQLRFLIIRVRMYFMSRRLKKQLNLSSLPELKELKQKTKGN
jgi:hypothetical protein